MAPPPGTLWRSTLVVTVIYRAGETPALPCPELYSPVALETLARYAKRWKDEDFTQSQVPGCRAGLRGWARHAGLSLHRGMALVRWFLHGHHYADHHRISGSPSPVARRARVQRLHHSGWSLAGVSGHRVAHPGFARIRAAELLWKAPHGARHRPSDRSLHHLRRGTRRPQRRPRVGAPSR